MAEPNSGAKNNSKFPSGFIKILHQFWLAPALGFLLCAASGGLWMWDRFEGSSTSADNLSLLLQLCIATVITGALIRLQWSLDVRERDLRALKSSEKRYRRLIDNADEGICVVDCQGKIRLLNAKAAELLGCNSENVVGQQMSDFLPLRFAESTERNDPGEHHAVRYECWVKRGRGESIYLSIGESAISDDCGQFAGLLVMFADLTNSKRAEEANSRLAAIVESSDDAITGITLEGAISDWNGGAERLYGYRRAEILGKPVATLMTADRVDEWQSIFKSVCCGARIRVKTKRRRKEGGLIDVWLTYSPIMDSEGKIIGLASIARDITSQEKMAAALRRSEERFQMAARGTRDIIWEWDIPRNRVWFSDNFWEAFGYDSATFPPGVEGWRGLVHPDDQSVIPVSLETYTTAEYRLRKADGSWAWVRDRMYLTKDATGKPLRKNGALTIITQEKEAQEALRASEQRYRRLFSENLAGVFRSTIDGRMLECNEACCQMLGYDSPAELYGIDLKNVFAEPGARAEMIRLLMERGKLVNYEIQCCRRDGSRFTGLSNMTLVADEFGNPTILEGTTMDVTETRHLQAQLLQAQKMEAIGRLAGGVAHDFNNLLMVISSYSELLLEETKNDRQKKYAEELLRAAQRGGKLTAQLLAFSRKQVIALRVIDVNEVVQEVCSMLPRLIGETISIETKLAEELQLCNADPSQIEQVLLNLCVNAKDAMPEGGKLYIETANVELEQQANAGLADVIPGDYVMIAVTDTGIGIDAATQAHIFEPFFTTKEIGKGTGLGLSSVYGIVKQSNGYVFVYSEPGRGSTFKVYLPAVTAKSEKSELVEAEQKPERAEGTVLLVEDDYALRESAAEFLKKYGYTVLCAQNAPEALDQLERYPGKVDALLTDVVMPGTTGLVLAKQVIELRQDIAVLYMSGYTEHTMLQNCGGALAGGYLQKPFTFRTLARKLETMMQTKKRAQTAN